MNNEPGKVLGSPISWHTAEGAHESLRSLRLSVIVAGEYTLVSLPIELKRKNMGTELWNAHLRTRLRSAEGILRKRVMMKVRHA